MQAFWLALFLPSLQLAIGGCVPSPCVSCKRGVAILSNVALAQGAVLLQRLPCLTLAVCDITKLWSIPFPDKLHANRSLATKITTSVTRGRPVQE